MTNKKMNNVEILLSKLDKGKLSDFIRKECINDSRFQDRFLALGAGFFRLKQNFRYMDFSKSVKFAA